MLRGVQVIGPRLLLLCVRLPLGLQQPGLTRSAQKLTLPGCPLLARFACETFWKLPEPVSYVVCCLCPSQRQSMCVLWVGLRGRVSGWVDAPGGWRQGDCRRCRYSRMAQAPRPGTASALRFLSPPASFYIIDARTHTRAHTHTHQHTHTAERGNGVFYLADAATEVHVMMGIRPQAPTRRPLG